MSLPAESRTFAREVQFSWLENSDLGLAGSYKLMVNARLLINIPFHELSTQTPLCRLRNAVLTDVRLGVLALYDCTFCKTATGSYIRKCRWVLNYKSSNHKPRNP